MAEAQHKKLTLYTDGAARGNPGPAGAGGVILSASGETLAEVSEYLGEVTNNVAEYRALIITLERALEFAPSRVEIRSDSELLVRQLRGEYKVKNEGLKPLFAQVTQLLSKVEEVDVRHIYRNENARADELANKAIDTHTKGEAPTAGQQPPEGVLADNPPSQQDFEQGSLF